MSGLRVYIRGIDIYGNPTIIYCSLVTGSYGSNEKILQSSSFNKNDKCYYNATNGNGLKNFLYPDS